MALYVARLEAFTQDFYVERVQLHKIVNDSVHEHKRFFIRILYIQSLKLIRTLL